MTQKKLAKVEKGEVIVKTNILRENTIKKCARQVIRKNRKVFDELANY